MSLKRPAMQFYPADYRNNANLRRCSWEARGAWIEVMGLMHDSDEYGILRWPLKEIAKAIGAPVRLLKELVEKGVLKGSEKKGEKVSFSISISQKNSENLTIFLLKNEENPLFFSSRMMRDEYIRNKRAAHGAKSLENMSVPRKKEQDKDTISTPEKDTLPTQDKDTISPSPTSSSSSSTTLLDISDPNNPSNKPNISDTHTLSSRASNFYQNFPTSVTEASEDNFAKFRALYPVPGNWLEAQTLWVQKKCDDCAEEIFADIPKRQEQCARWEEMRYIPNPEKYLKNEVWKNAIVQKSTDITGNAVAYGGPRDIAKIRADHEARQAKKKSVG